MKTKKENQGKEKPVKGKRPQKEKSSGYVMRKNTYMKFMRIILWVMLTFIFMRGVVSIFERDKSDVMAQMIRDFKANYSKFTNQNEEVMSFAQNFTREYLTYEARGEADYKERLKKYVSNNFFNEKVSDFSAGAEAVYVQAYRMEDYSSTQKDVYVLAEVEYSKNVLGEEQSYTNVEERKPVTLKVPVYCENGNYVVEGIPLLVADSVSVERYLPEEYYGTTISDADAAKVKTSVENFLKAYYEQDESVINYYLDSAADKQSFLGLEGRFVFLEISSIKCYQGEEGIICLVNYRLKDVGNDVKMLQKIHLTVKESGGKYYICDMNARTGNLKVN